MKRWLLAFTLCLISAKAFPSDYLMSFRPGTLADSINWKFLINGDSVAAGQRTNTYGWDSTFTWTLTNDSLYQIVHYTYYPGNDSAVSHMEQWGRGASNGGWFVDAHYGYELDTLIANLYTNGSLTSSDSFNSVYGLTDTIAVTSPNQYTWQLLSIVGGLTDYQSFTMSLQTDTSEGTIVAPGTNRCAVTFSIVDDSGDPVKNVWVSVSMVGGNKADSAGNAVINTVQGKPTDVNGLVTFNMIWSSYLIPATNYFIKVGQGIGRYYTVPRQTSVLVDFSTL